MLPYPIHRSRFQPPMVSLVVVDNMQIDLLETVSKWTSQHPAVGGLDLYAPRAHYPSLCTWTEASRGRGIRAEACVIRYCSNISSAMSNLSKILLMDTMDIRQYDIIHIGMLETVRRVLHNEISSALMHSSDNRIWMHVRQNSDSYSVTITVLTVGGRDKSELIDAINDACASRTLVVHQP